MCKSTSSYVHVKFQKIQYEYKNINSVNKCFSMAYYDVHFVYNTKNVLLNFLYGNRR